MHFRSSFPLSPFSFSPFLCLLSLPMTVLFFFLSSSFFPFLRLLSLPLFVFFLSLSSSSFSSFLCLFPIPFFSLFRLLSPRLRLLSLPFIVFLLKKRHQKTASTHLFLSLALRKGNAALLLSRSTDVQCPDIMGQF